MWEVTKFLENPQSDNMVRVNAKCCSGIPEAAPSVINQTMQQLKQKSWIYNLISLWNLLNIYFLGPHQTVGLLASSHYEGGQPPVCPVPQGYHLWICRWVSQSLVGIQGEICWLLQPTSAIYLSYLRRDGWTHGVAIWYKWST